MTKYEHKFRLQNVFNKMQRSHLFRKRKRGSSRQRPGLA